MVTDGILFGSVIQPGLAPKPINAKQFDFWIPPSSIVHTVRAASILHAFTSQLERELIAITTLGTPLFGGRLRRIANYSQKGCCYETPRLCNFEILDGCLNRAHELAH